MKRVEFYVLPDDHALYPGRFFAVLPSGEIITQMDELFRACRKDGAALVAAER